MSTTLDLSVPHLSAAVATLTAAHPTAAYRLERGARLVTAGAVTGVYGIGYFVTSENDARTQAYTLFIVRAGYEYKPWQLGAVFQASNLTNATYASSVVVDAANKRFYEPGDGRAVYGSLQWRWR